MKTDMFYGRQQLGACQIEVLCLLQNASTQLHYVGNNVQQSTAQLHFGTDKVKVILNGLGQKHNIHGIHEMAEKNIALSVVAQIFGNVHHTC